MSNQNSKIQLVKTNYSTGKEDSQISFVSGIEVIEGTGEINISRCIINRKSKELEWKEEDEFRISKDI